MNIIEKMEKQPVYLKGEYGSYHTEPSNGGFSVQKKTPQGEVSIPQSDNGFSSALAYDGVEITKKQYQES